LPVEFRQSRFEHLPVPGIARNLQLLQNVLPREFNAIPLVRSGDLLRAQTHLCPVLIRGKLLLLLFNRLALPSASHIPILIGITSARNLP
jgi:hypothetical protein